MKEIKKGSLLIIIAYILWGFFPLYWNQLHSLSSVEVIAYRILFSFLICIVIVIATKKLSVYRNLLNKKELIRYIFISLLLFINWFVFIYAVTNNQVLDAGMGYYLNPLVSITLGIVFLKERLNRLQIVAVMIASVGILYYIISMKVVPIIALTLAFTFGTYGLFKKKTHISGIHSMTLESTILAPIAMIILLIMSRGEGIALFNADGKTTIFIVLAGAVTLLPLVLFAEATKRIPLTRVGFLQLIAPTLMFVSGLLMGETVNPHQLITFGMIWIALILYTISIIRSDRNEWKNNQALTTGKK